MDSVSRYVCNPARVKFNIYQQLPHVPRNLNCSIGYVAGTTGGFRGCRRRSETETVRFDGDTGTDGQTLCMDNWGHG